MEYVWLFGMLLFATSSLTAWIRVIMQREIIDGQRRHIEDFKKPKRSG